MRLIGLAGWSGAGKTTLLASVIPAIRRRGLTVSTVKHAHHSFDVDTPGKDSHTHRLAGASEVLVSSRHRFALMHELREEPEPGLADLLRRLSPVDLVLVEGFKADPHPKLEIHRIGTGKPFLHPQDDWIRAIATDAPGPYPIPRFDLDAVDAIAGWMIEEAHPLEQFLADRRRSAMETPP
jgi:molybdopterin-guanine dinucleotide biosynthesis protein B